VPGRPQSASGQATILTGRNIPAAIGEHYGPRPNPAIRALVRADNLFLRVTQAGGSAALINGYPPRFHEAISSGKRLPSAYQEAVLGAGLPIFTEVEMYAETAMSPDWPAGPAQRAGYATRLSTRAERGATSRGWPASAISRFLTQDADVVGTRPAERGVALVEC